MTSHLSQVTNQDFSDTGIGKVLLCQFVRTLINIRINLIEHCKQLNIMLFLDGTVVRTWKSLHLTPVVELVFDSTTTLVASGGTDGSLKVWDIRRQYCTHNLKGGSGVYR